MEIELLCARVRMKNDEGTKFETVSRYGLRTFYDFDYLESRPDDDDFTLASSGGQLFMLHENYEVIKQSIRDNNQTEFNSISNG